MPDLIQLDDKRLKQLDGNIKQMVSSGASQDDVMKYAFDFKNQFGLKKKDGGEISSPIELPSVSPDFEKGKAFAEKGFLMKSEGTKEQKRMSFEPSLFGGAPEVKVLEEGEEPSILADFTSSAIKGQIQGKVANILSTGKRPTNEELGQIAQLQSDLQLFPQSKSEKAFQEKGLKALFKETPSLGVQFIAETMASSLSSLFEASKRTVPTAVAMGAAAGAPFAGIGALVGAGTGLLAGQSAAGYNISTSQDILSSLSENGVDISDKESLINAFSDETKMAKIRSTAAKYGIPILVFDVATAGLAGKLAAGAIGKSLSKKLLAGVGETGIQIIGGSGGELAAQINSGKKVNWDEIAIEGFAEIPGGVTEVATGVAIERAKSSSNNKTLATQIATQGGENGSEDAIINLNRDLSNNVITPEQHQEGVDFVQKAAQVVDKIPETVTGESKVKSVELLVERNDIKQANQNLLQQKQTTDEAYHAGIDEEIKANEEKIKKIDSEVYDITKKPSKEFGTKKYEIDGEEVSQGEFEAMQGKPEGTKEIVEPTEIGGLKVIKRVEDAGGEAVYEVEGERFLTADGKELAVSKVKIPTEVKPTEDINNVNVTIEGTTDGYKVISGDKANSIGDIRQEANEARAKGQDTFTTETIKDGKKIFTLTDTTVSDNFGRPGFKSASISFPEGTKVTMEDVMAKLKSELGVKEVKPTEVEVKPTNKTESFLNDADVMFPNDDIRGGYAVTNESGKQIGRVKMSEVDENTVKIDEVVSEKRGERTGNGSAIMKMVVDNADKNNVKLVLTPNLIGEMKAKGFETADKLRSFYEKFGFVKDKGKATMTREPKEIEVKEEVKPTEEIDIYDHQDKNAEIIVSDSKWKGQVWRYKFENAGDILRELAKYKNEFLDPGYIYEKVDKIREWLDKQKEKQIHIDDSYGALKEKDSELLNKLKNSYKNQPVLTEAQQKAKDLVLNLIDGNLSAAENQVKYFEQFKGDDVRDKLKEANLYPEQKQKVKPTEVKEDVKVEEVKKSKLEAYKEKYAQKQKIEPIKIEDNGNPIIAKDPAENDIAIAKLAKQDNPVEESSIKAIEGKAEGDIKAKLNEVIAGVDDKIKLATRIEMVAMNDLKTDEASFQNREGLNLKKVDDIVANYNPSEFDPIIYWTDANGQKYTLNHHRFAAAQKLKLDEIPAQKLTYPLGHPKEFQVVPATDKAEAIDFAINRSNANRSMETAVERAKALRKLQKTGTKEDVNKFLEREGKNKTKIQNIAALNENGKTIDALKMFGDAEDVQLQKETEQRSDWIGEARRRISGLTNEHENEMFDFLMDKDASKRITSKADFISKVTSLAGGFDFNPENPLNLKRFKYQTEGERAYDEVTGQLKSEIDTRQTKIDDLKARFSDPSRRDYIPTNSRDYEQTKKIADDQISKLNTEIKSFQQKLQDHYKEKGKYQGGIEQGGLFATEQATTEEIDDMSNIVKDFYDDGIVKLDDIKKEVAKELGFNNKQLEDVVEQAYNKMVMEYTPVEISKGVIGKVGEKLNELGEDGVVMLEDDQSIFAKAAQLAETGGRVEFQATLPNGEKVTAKPVDASIVNGFYSPLELQINQMKADKMPAKQWLDKLRGEEAKWTGLADWLSQQQGSLSKQEIKDWLQDNQIEINEIVKGRAEDLTEEQLDRLKYLAKIDAENPSGAMEDIEAGSYDEFLTLLNIRDKSSSNDLINLQKQAEQKARLAQQRGDKKLADKYWEDSHRYTSRHEVLELSMEGEGGILNPTKFSNYQLEGEKEDYAEILVTLPSKAPTSKAQLQRKIDALNTKQQEEIDKARAAYISNLGLNINDKKRYYFAVDENNNKVVYLAKDQDDLNNWKENKDDVISIQQNAPAGIKNKEQYEEYFNPTSDLIDKLSSEIQVLELEIEKPQSKKDIKFQSDHYDEADILVHLRMNIRKDAQGKKVLFLEEVQSDWGQKGKKEGFQSGDLQKLENTRNLAREDVKKIDKEIDEYYDKNKIKKIGLSDAEENAYANISAKMRNGVATEEEIAQRQLYIEKDTYFDSQYDLAKRDNKFNELLKIKGDKLYIMISAVRNYDAASAGKPSAPFVMDTNVWTKLGLKVALKEAVKQGADKIAWTTGEQQVGRYEDNFRKQVDNIDSERFEAEAGKPSRVRIIAYKNGAEVFNELLPIDGKTNIRGKDVTIDDIVGKDIAQKIREGEDQQSFTGNQLTIGGSGMKGFYGSTSEGSLGILGNMAKSLFKQEPSKISIISSQARINELQKEMDLHQEHQTYFLSRRDDAYDNGDKEKAIEMYALANKSGQLKESVLSDIKKIWKYKDGSDQLQYSINITPELKAQVEIGLPLFMAKPSGDILGFTYGKTIYLNASKINPNTPIHEGGHIWTRWVKKNNPKVYDRGMELVKNTKYLERAKSSKFYQEQAAKLPQAEREAYFQEEALNQAIGDKGAQFVAEAKKSSFKEWLDNLWDVIKNAAGFDNITAKELQNLTFDEFAKRAARDILSPKSEQLKPTQNAIQEQSAKEKVPRAISTGEDITEGGERVRPSKQRAKITAESKGDEEAVRMRSLYKQVITRSKGLTEEQKSILKNDPNALYTVLPIAESKRIALELIQEMGVAEAVAEASSSTTTLQPVERTMILGAAMDYYAKLGKEKLKEGDVPSAQTAARKEIDADEELRRVASTLGQLGTDYGRAINAFKEIYKLSSLALERKLVKDVEELNEEREEGATEDAKQIKKIITEDASDIEDVADELTNEEIESKLDAAKKVSDLEKQVENLRREILERDKAQKGTKKNPLRIKRITNDTEYDKRLKDFKQRARSIVSKDDLVDLTYFGLYHIENGVTKFADWYKEMSKNFKGFRSQFKNIYNSVAEKAAENGADRNMFDNDETIQSVLDDFQQETDAKKIVQATKKVAQAKLKREEENNPERAVKIAPSLAAERIRKDAEKNLDMPSTEVEQTYLKRLVKVINNKAKEYYAEKKENISNVNDVLAFAIANGKKDFAIWERTQTELEEQIDEDEKLTEDEKEEVKDFLQAYRESIFETLLTKNQISEAVREKLIENGYFVERIVKGTPVKSVDWSKITGNASTLKEAKEKIVKSITDLGFTEAQAKGEINAILDYFDAKISEKKTAEINKYLQKGILNKIKALGKKKVKRNSVDKLVELNKKGLLDDAKIKEILAAELGLMEITNDDLKNLREWSSKVDDENTPIFIRKEFEEKIQYLFDTKSGNINYLENRAASMSNRLSSVVNQVINLTGFLRAPSTLITVAATTGKPIVAARVFLKELVNAAQEAKTIMKGRVSRGSSFDDLIGTTSGQPRVRYLEQGNGKFLGGKALGKPIYVQIGGNKVDLNPINFGYSKIKYISRLLESADTMASGPISGVTQFRIATKEINRYYPELSAAQRSQKVYDILYTVDRATELQKAIKDLKNAGVTNPTEAEINRTINERVERARSERLANDFYNQAKSLNLISETKLKADGIANPTEDEILAQSYKTLGSTQAADLVARGERQAARETGKMTTRGITSIILLPVDMIQKSLNSGLKSKSKSVTTLSEIGDVSFSVLMPFANSIARWAEMTGELFAPYGIAKGAAYKIGAKFTSKESKISAEEYSDLGDDYLIRGTQGLAMTLLIMYAVGMLNKAEDDEQEELGKSFTGTAKEKQYALEKVQSVGKPKQSVNILGTNVSLAFLGNQGLAIGMYADFLKLRSKRKLDENMTERGELFISGLAAMEAFGGYMFDATYLSTAKKYGSAASSLIEMKEEGYMPTLGRLAGGIISSQIPFNRLQVEAATLFNPKSQSSKDFGSNLLAQMSITRAFQSGKPNFDYRGREYDYGDIYANSADGIRKMFGKAKYGDEIDAFLSEINFAATDAYRETRDEDNYKFSIINSDYTHRFMTNEEYYEFKKKTALEFNKQITGKYEEIIRTIDRLSNPERYDLNGIKKKIVSDLLSEAKEDAFEEIQNSIFKPSKSRLLKAENRKKAISDKVSNIAAKFKKK